MNTIPMAPANDYDRKHYGVTFRSAFVYRFAGSSSPTRIVVWDNTCRPNSRGGNGAYLDPRNVATDDAVTVLITPECGVISAHGDGTGTVASGQVYDRTRRFVTGDELVLTYPDGTTDLRTVAMTSNGHGRAVAA